MEKHISPYHKSDLLTIDDVGRKEPNDIAPQVTKWARICVQKAHLQYVPPKKS